MDLIVRLESDHRFFLMTSGRLLAMVRGDDAGGSGEQAVEALETLQRLKAGLARHEQMECRLLHPLVRSCHPACSAALEGSEREHRDLRRIMEEMVSLLSARTRRPALRRSLGELDRLLRDHLFHEEETVFVLAGHEVPAPALMRLGEQAERLPAPQSQS